MRPGRSGSLLLHLGLLHVVVKSLCGLWRNTGLCAFGDVRSDGALWLVGIFVNA